MLFNHLARQERALIEIAQMADGNQLIQITQADFIFRQNNNVIAGNFASALIGGSIRVFSINVISLQLTVTDKVALHAENQLQITALGRIKAERECLHHTMISNRQRLVSPADSLLDKSLHRCERVHLAHLGMAVQLYTLFGSIVHTLRNFQFHDSTGHHSHLVKGKTVWGNITHQTQPHTWLQQIFKFVAFLACVLTITLIKA